jgi:integrase
VDEKAEIRRKRTDLPMAEVCPFSKNQNFTGGHLMSTTQLLLDQAEQLSKHNRQGSYATRKRYYEVLKRLCGFLGDVYHLEKLRNIDSKHIYAYVDYMLERRLSAATIKTELSAIRFWYDKIDGAKNRLPSNAELCIERRSFGKIDRSWSEREVMRFLLVCYNLGRHDYVAVASLAYYAGLRIHECFRIDTAIARNAVKTGFLTIKGKGGKFRTVPVGPEITDKLAEFLKTTPSGHKLFVPEDMPTGKAINQMQDFIREHRDDFRDEDNDYDLTCHGLRHSYAAKQYTTNRNDGKTDYDAKKAVSPLLGHNRAEVTNVYLAGVKKGKDGDGGDGNV